MNHLSCILSAKEDDIIVLSDFIGGEIITRVIGHYPLNFDHKGYAFDNFPIAGKISGTNIPSFYGIARNNIMLDGIKKELLKLYVEIYYIHPGDFDVIKIIKAK